MGDGVGTGVGVDWAGALPNGSRGGTRRCRLWCGGGWPVAEEMSHIEDAHKTGGRAGQLAEVADVDCARAAGVLGGVFFQCRAFGGCRGLGGGGPGRRCAAGRSSGRVSAAGLRGGSGRSRAGGAGGRRRAFPSPGPGGGSWSGGAAGLRGGGGRSPAIGRRGWPLGCSSARLPRTVASGVAALPVPARPVPSFLLRHRPAAGRRGSALERISAGWGGTGVGVPLACLRSSSRLRPSFQMTVRSVARRPVSGRTGPLVAGAGRSSWPPGDRAQRPAVGDALACSGACGLPATRPVGQSGVAAPGRTWPPGYRRQAAA